MKKRIIACILVLMMLVSAIGCGKSSTPGENPPDTEPSSSTGETSTGGTQAQEEAADAQTREEYVIDIMDPEASSFLSTDTALGQIIKEKFNIVFNVTSYSGNYDEQVALMVSGQSYPEIVRLRNNEDIQTYAKAGALLDLEELANSCGAQNFLAYHKDTIQLAKMSSGDGHLYTWEYDSPQVALSSDIWIRSDVLEAAGWPDVLTEDEWIDVLKIGMEQFPETNGQPTIGLTMPGGEGYGVQGIMPILYEKGGYTAMGGNNAVIYNDKEDKYEDYFQNEYVKSSLRFFNRLYQEGLLDPECFSDLSSQTNEKAVAGRALALWYTGGWYVKASNAALEEAGHPEMSYVEMPVMSQDQIDNGETRHFRELQNYPYQSMAITKNARYPERIMEMLDYFSSEEGQILLGWGIEGEHYTVEDGVRTPTQELLDEYHKDAGYLSKQGIGNFEFLGLSKGMDDSGQYYQMTDSKSFKMDTLSDRAKEVYGHYGWEIEEDIWFKNDRFDIEFIPSGVVGTVSLDPTSSDAKLEQQLVDFRNKATVEIVMSSDFEDTYTRKLEEYEKLGAESVVAAYNKIYEEQKKALE